MGGWIYEVAVYDDDRELLSPEVDKRQRAKFQCRV